MIFDPVLISDLNELCNRYGLDSISTGNVIAWAMEATEKGLIQSRLRFGSKEYLPETILEIATREGLGAELGLGTRRLSQRYGGRDFAMNVKGLELAAYDPRGSWGQALSYAVANRGGCHLSSAIFTAEVFFGLQRPFTLFGKGPMVAFMEDVTCAVNSMVMCLFTAFAIELEPPVVRYTPKWVLRYLLTYLNPIVTRFMDISPWPRLWSAITGRPMTTSKWLEAGKRIHVLERYMNTLEGISRKDDTLPQRFLVEGRWSDPKARTVPLQRLLDRYYRTRGYDQDGIPRLELLRRLGIAS
jgi:aldehyde:ferredoxin oxidoreductase